MMQEQQAEQPKAEGTDGNVRDAEFKEEEKGDDDTNQQQS